MNIENLRKKLNEVIEIKNPSKNIEYIDNLEKETPHRIKLVETSNFDNNFYPNSITNYALLMPEIYPESI